MNPERAHAGGRKNYVRRCRCERAMALSAIPHILYIIVQICADLGPCVIMKEIFKNQSSIRTAK